MEYRQASYYNNDGGVDHGEMTDLYIEPFDSLPGYTAARPRQHQSSAPYHPRPKSLQMSTFGSNTNDFHQIWSTDTPPFSNTVNPNARELPKDWTASGSSDTSSSPTESVFNRTEPTIPQRHEEPHGQGRPLVDASPQIAATRSGEETYR